MLELAVARALYDRFPDASEGRLAKIRAHVVSRHSCAAVAREPRPRRAARRAGAGHSRGRAQPHLAQSERPRGPARGGDRGGVPRVRLRPRPSPPIVAAFDDRIEFARTGHIDNKTELQEALARSGKQVQYVVLDVDGPAHDRRFVCAASIDGEQLGTGSRHDEEGGRAGGRGARPGGTRLPRGSRGDDVDPADSGRLGGTVRRTDAPSRRRVGRRVRLRGARLVQVPPLQLLPLQLEPTSSSRPAVAAPAAARPAVAAPGVAAPAVAAPGVAAPAVAAPGGARSRWSPFQVPPDQAGAGCLAAPSRPRRGASEDVLLAGEHDAVVGQLVGAAGELERCRCRWLR